MFLTLSMIFKIVAKDSNVILVGIAAICLTGITRGLRKMFSPFVLNVSKSQTSESLHSTFLINLPVLTDHLSYITFFFKHSLVRSHKTGLIL